MSYSHVLYGRYYTGCPGPYVCICFLDFFSLEEAMMLKTKLDRPLDYAVYVYDARLSLVDYTCVFYYVEN